MTDEERGEFEKTIAALRGELARQTKWLAAIDFFFGLLFGFALAAIVFLTH